jgi:CRP-like cAMP-binding protein/HEAT repeat protein
MGEIQKRQQRALAKAKQVLLDAEKARAQNRVGTTLKEFTSGNLKVLNDQEFSENLGPYLYQLYQAGRRSEAIALLCLFDDCIVEEDLTIRENSVLILSKFSSSIIDSNDLEILYKTFSQFVRWLEFETEYITGFGVACSQIHRITQRLLADEKYWQEALKLTSVLTDIQSGTLDKSSSIKETISKLQESIAAKETLEKLIHFYLKNTTENKRIAARILTTLGRRSAIYLINQLMHSTDKNVRLQLVKLIPGAGGSVIPILKDCLQKKPPWYVVRNVIFILSELNDDSFYEIIQPYLSHRDIRVQQQVLSCITKISEDNLRERLIASLPSVHDDLKIKVVMQFGEAGGDKNLVNVLVELLRSRQTFLEETSSELIVRICVALKSSPQKEVIEVLNQLIEERKDFTDQGDPVIVAANDALSVVEPKYRHTTQASLGASDGYGSEFHMDSLATNHSSILKLEQSVEQYIAQGDLEKAGGKLYSNAVNAARNKDYTTAELLRDKLLDINPLALTEVIRLGEIIEEEKSSTINNHHISVWSGLYDTMSTDEFNALYYTMRHESYSPDETIVRAGENDASLYFVNSGSVTLSCQSGDKESFLKRLQPGEVIGVGPFFSVSVWTVSMAAQTASQVHVLSRRKFLVLKKNHPKIERKLESFCNKYDTVPELLKMSGADRRESARYSIAVKVNNILLDPYGNAGKRSFRGELIDISKGGLCFSIKISSRQNARLLLGRQIVTEITLRDGNILKCFGVIVGVKFYEIDVQDFSVHVKFYRSLEQVDFKQVINLEL